MTLAGQKRKREHRHAYLSGNFAPIQQTRSLTTCTYTGVIPTDLVGGQYVRNGGNPVSNDDLGRDAHWFDGDGMLSGVLFRPSGDKNSVQPAFVNQYILTDVHLSATSTRSLRTPILPSITTLVNPASALITIIARIFRTILLVILSFLPGSKQAIKKISVANTSILYHDGRALATCESGPPIRVQLPELDTVGWFNGSSAAGEVGSEHSSSEPKLGGDGLIGFMKEWTTGHPKVDPLTKEMILFHCTFIRPFVHYSVIPANHNQHSTKAFLPKLLNIPVPGVSGGKMMHDFGVSRSHTVIMDLPLSLDPFNLIHNRPVVSYDHRQLSRFGVFPRRDAAKVRWYETSACCIFHTANTWDEYDSDGDVTHVNMLACRLTSATLVFSAGNIAAPPPPPTPGQKVEPEPPISFFAGYDNENAYRVDEDSDETSPLVRHIAPPGTSTDLEKAPSQEHNEEQCRLYLYSFSIRSKSPEIERQFALSILPFEFPTVNSEYGMSFARYIYGCSTFTATFGAALGKATKIDILLKADAQTLIARGKSMNTRDGGVVDERNIQEVLASTDESDPIKAFQMPAGWYAQEATFVARKNALSEDDGYLLFYAFDETQIDESGDCPASATSQLWILDARNMQDIVARVELPQRVPYGLHGNWFSEQMIEEQRPVESLRSLPSDESNASAANDWTRRQIMKFLG